ncbi:MAG: diaminobutyrate acetyltransferase [Gammaproteobacteria bacterium]|nr:diaminobutyrate acetyltransferase [Gammaproteobacteria bacterium]
MPSEPGATAVIDDVTCRPPTVEDGASVWRLVRDSGQLDLNSSYAYLLMCQEFSATCAVAEIGGELAGFVTGFRPPQRPDTLFVWQVGTSAAARGRGIASRMILDILQRRDAPAFRYLEATVDPDNEPSRALFTGLARKLETGLDETDYFIAGHFPGEHAPEPLFRIGPFHIHH